MDPESLELVLSGDIDKKSELYDIAYTYVRKISLRTYELEVIKLLCMMRLI